MKLPSKKVGAITALALSACLFAAPAQSNMLLYQAALDDRPSKEEVALLEDRIERIEIQSKIDVLKNTIELTEDSDNPDDVSRHAQATEQLAAQESLLAQSIAAKQARLTAEINEQADRRAFIEEFSRQSDPILKEFLIFLAATLTFIFLSLIVFFCFYTYYSNKKNHPND